MKKISIIGKPFAYLEQTLMADGIDFNTIENPKELDPSMVHGSSAILIIGMNLALNSSSLDTWHSTLKSSPNAVPVVFWNHEPFWDTTSQGHYTLFGRDIFHFNAHLKNIYLSPFSIYFGVGGYLWAKSRIAKISLPAKEHLLKRFTEQGKKTCAYASCFHDKRLTIKSSIVKSRNDLIKSFYDAGICDVYGRGWSHQWQLDVTEESRAGRTEGDTNLSWGQIKVEQSRTQYSFSVCLENCLIENYVTEKFAHAIESNLLPIYCKGNNLENYLDVSPAIMVDTKSSNQDVARNIVDTMSFAEYYDRLSAITDSYNQLLGQTRFIDSERRRPARELVKALKELT